MLFPFFTKQNIGILFIIVELLFSYKNKKELLQKIGGFLLVCFLFLMYFIITKSLYDFINQTFLGLLNFSKKNNTSLNIFSYLSMLLIIAGAIYLLKNINLENSILFATIFLTISVYDYIHLILGLSMFILLIINKIKCSINKLPFIILGIECLLLATIIYQNFNKDHIYPTTVKYLNYFYHPKASI